MCYIFGNQNLIVGRSPQVVKTKKTRSAVVISFQVVSRRDGCSKVHSRRIWYSIFYHKHLYLFGVHPQVTAAATAAAEEFSSSTSPHPITHRDTISRSDHPSLR